MSTVDQTEEAVQESPGVDSVESLRKSIAHEVELKMERRFAQFEAEQQRRMIRLRADYRQRDWFLAIVTLVAFLSAAFAWASFFV